MKNKRIISIFFILISLFILVGFKNDQSIKSKLSEDNIKKHLEFLVGLNGRKVGTEDNERTVEYIEEHFKSIGIDFIKGDKYTTEFDALTYSFDGEPRFNVIDEKGLNIKSYTEGIDYKIRLDDLAIGGMFKGKIEHINTTEQLTKNEIEFPDMAVLIDYNDEKILNSGFQGSILDDRIFYDGAKVLIYPELRDIGKKEVNLGTKNKQVTESGIIKLGVSPNVYEELIEYYERGYTLDIDIPVSFIKTRAKNVMGIIKGQKKNYDKTILIATSIDGLGENYNSVPYPGASDNGASTALFLEMARYMVENNIKIDSDIVFLGINAEKIGYLGYDNFYREDIIPYGKTEVIYLDDIGATVDGDLIIGSYVSEESQFQNNKLVLNQMASKAEEMGINFKKDDLYYDSSYMEFRKLGMITTILTYGENPLAKTVKDNGNNINLKKIKTVGEITIDYIKDYGNINILKEIKSVLISTWWIILFGIALAYIKFIYLKDHEFGKVGELIKTKPIITIYLVILFVVLTVVLQTKNGQLIGKGILIEDVKLSGMSILENIANNILSIGTMILFFTPALGCSIGIVVFMIWYKDRKKISDALSLIVTGFIIYLLVMININQFYSYKFSTIFPKLFALEGSQYIVILIIAFYTALVIYCLGKENKSIKNIQQMFLFVLFFFIFVSLLYSPYILSSSLISLKRASQHLRF